MGCGVNPDEAEEAACPAVLVASEDWGLDDPEGRPIRKSPAMREESGSLLEALVTASDEWQGDRRHLPRDLPAASICQVLLASSVISTPASALDTGHPALASFACFWNAASSMLGTSASVMRWLFVMLKPSPSFSTVTLAVV